MKPTYVAYLCFFCGKPVADRPVFVGDWNLHLGCYHQLGGGSLDLQFVKDKLQEINQRRIKMATSQYENKAGYATGEPGIRPGKGV